MLTQQKQEQKDGSRKKANAMFPHMGKSCANCGNTGTLEKDEQRGLFFCKGGVCKKRFEDRAGE